MTPSEETFDGTGGIRIFFRCWRPAGTQRAVVVICHGVNSHGGQYGWAAEVRKANASTWTTSPCTSATSRI